MPRFFIDSDDGKSTVIDNEGYDLRNAREARALAVQALPEMAWGKVLQSDRRDFSVRVRDDRGAVIYTATLSLAGEWHVDPGSL